MVHRTAPWRASRPTPGRTGDLHLARERLLQELDESQPEAAESSWALGYLDLLLLLVTLFAVLLGLSYLRPGLAPSEASALLGIELDLSAAAAAPTMVDPHALAQALQSRAPPPAPAPAPPQPATPALELPAGLSFDIQPAVLEPEEMDRILRRVARTADGRLDLSYDRREIRLEVRDDILFPLGSAELGSDGRVLLEQLADTLAPEEMRISVEGHTDDLPIHTERFPSNWELSSLRATTVARHLIAHGVAQARIQVIGYGDTRPRVPNDSPQHRSRNRRVSIVLHRSEPAGGVGASWAGMGVPDRGERLAL